MKILIVASEYPPIGTGIANGVINLEKQFKKLEHEVSIMSPVGPHFTTGSAKGWKKIGGLAILSFWKEARKEIIKQLDNFDFIICRNPLFNKSIESKKILCTTHTTYNGRWEHQYFNNPLKAFYYKYMILKEAKCYKAMENMRFAVLTTKIGEEVEFLGIKKYDIIPNGVDTEVYTPGIKKGQACASTRLESWKKVEIMVKNFNELGQHLKIAGDGPMLNKLKNIAKDNIEFLGKISKEEVIKLYKESNMYISTSEYEGMPNSLLEALSCGCVPQVSKIPGHTELINLIGDEEDPQKIHELIKQNYDWSIIAKKYLRLIENGDAFRSDKITASEEEAKEEVQKMQGVQE